MKKIGSLTAAGLALISGSKIATAEQTTTINKLAANGYNHEAWSFNYLFCSQLGGNLPDPSKRLCKLMAEFDQDKFDEKELAESAFRIISEDSAILPIGHAGLTWFVSPGIKLESLSPLISVIRFDDVELEP